eukprot:jgi/Botrbrau1/6172/Bobra.0344s0013.1
MTKVGCSCWPLITRRKSMPSTKDSLAAAQQFLEEKLANNASAVVHEYERLRTYTPKPREAIDVHSAANHPENRAKNRYCDVLPYDKTRVRLTASGLDPSAQPTDAAQREWAGYINASHLQSPEGSSSRSEASWPKWEYIGTQGPLPQTIPDFWELAYEQNCTVILMLTNHIEGNIRKCEDYLPKRVNEPQQFGAFTVTVTSVLDFCDDIQQREVLLHRSNDPGQPRKILHYHYHTWPDHGSPTTTEPLRRLARAVEAHTQERSCGPPLVHCSAGAPCCPYFQAVACDMEPAAWT